MYWLNSCLQEWSAWHLVQSEEPDGWTLNQGTLLYSKYKKVQGTMRPRNL